MTYRHNQSNRIANVVVTVLMAAGWSCLLWLWIVEYEKRLDLFREARLKIPLFAQSIMEKLPYLAAVAAVLSGVGLWMMWRRGGKWWQSALLVFIMVGLNAAVAMGLWLTDLAYEYEIRRQTPQQTGATSRFPERRRGGRITWNLLTIRAQGLVLLHSGFPWAASSSAS